MTWSIGSLTLDADEEPEDGAIQFVQPKHRAEANPLGFTGRIIQTVYTDAREHTLHLLLSVAHKDALKALYDADAVVPVVFPAPPFDSGVNMLIADFSAIWNSNVRGLPWYDCTVRLVEQ